MALTRSTQWPKVPQLKINLACAVCSRRGVWTPKTAHEMRKGTIPGGWIDWNGEIFCPTHADGTVERVEKTLERGTQD